MDPKNPDPIYDILNTRVYPVQSTLLNFNPIKDVSEYSGVYGRGCVQKIVWRQKISGN